MGSHPINLAVRLLLEVFAYVVMGSRALAGRTRDWGATQGQGLLRFVLALGIPALFAILWGTFAVPDDPSRSGRAPVPIPGLLRLALELAFFAFAAWALYNLGNALFSAILAALVTLHYILSYDRIAWLIRQ